MEFVVVSLLNGLSYGLLLFMLSSGLTLIFSMMGVLNFAHASFYMLGAYVAYAVSRRVGFWPSLVIAPLAVAAVGALFERYCLRRVHRHGNVAELLVTFGLSYIVLEVVHLLWGRAPVAFDPPAALQGPAFTLVSSADGLALAWGRGPAVCGASDEPGTTCTPFPATRVFMMTVSIAMLLGLWIALARTRIGLVIRSALTHAEMVQALGHDVPRVFMLVFGAGAGLAALAGVIGGSTFVTEPAMAATVGSVIFVVVVVGGMGSLAGAFLASVLIGLLQTFAVGVDHSLLDVVRLLGLDASAALGRASWLGLSVSQLAPILPYLLLVATLVVRPRGLLGTRD